MDKIKLALSTAANIILLFIGIFATGLVFQLILTYYFVVLLVIINEIYNIFKKIKKEHGKL